MIAHRLHVLPISKSVLDPIYGLVALTPEELKIINSPTFQRLRNVKQNGLLHLIWPGATHTRFEHSIGALYAADCMLQSLLFNSAAAGKNKLRALSDAAPGQAIDFSTIDDATTIFLFRITRIAALVHDLGHGPFSHTFDSFAPRIEDITKVLQDPRLAALEPLKALLLKSDDGRVTHEAMSCIFFCSIWRELNSADQLTPQVVAAVILGQDAHKQFECTDRKWVPLIHDLISSAPADADRMDYLERDSRSLGVTYGLFDRNRLLKSILCYRSTNDDYRLGWKHSGLRAVENFVQARFELFVQVYYHKTNRAIGLMLDEVAKLAREANIDLFGGQAHTLDGIVGQYISLSDDRFMRLLVGAEAPLADYHQIRAIASQIDKRILWKRVYEVRRPANANPDSNHAAFVKETLDRVHQELANAEPSLKLVDDIYDPKATKDLDRGAVLLDRGSDGFYAIGQEIGWTVASPIIRVLFEEERSIGRIYARDATSEQLAKLRQVALQDTGGLR